jgi:aminoglycoside phosphotransferase (APT) family kinase protein
MKQSQPAPPFLGLLDHLADAGPRADGAWRGWQIARVAGAGNNLLYRATGDQLDLAIKFAIRDERDRAGREYAALLALQQAGLSIAPAPLWLERERYPQPVVVQSWLAGDVLAAAPSDDREWQRLLDHYLAVHMLTPARIAPIALPPAVLNFTSADHGLREIRRQLDTIPTPEQPADLRELVRNIQKAALPTWPTPRLALCRVDPNTLNFVRRSSTWASVDWENSGWGDPAFEIADLMSHPAYATVPAERWQWLFEAYCAQCDSPGTATRIQVYYRLMLIWWVARLARMLYEVPLGGDQRLVGRPDDWQLDIQAKYERYIWLARSVQADSWRLR